MTKKEKYQQAMTWVAQEREHFAAIDAYVRELEKDIAIKDTMANVVKLLGQAGSYEDYADDARDDGDDRLCEKYRGLAAGCRSEADRLKCEVDRLRDGLPVRQSEAERNV